MLGFPIWEGGGQGGLAPGQIKATLSLQQPARVVFPPLFLTGSTLPAVKALD